MAHGLQHICALLHNELLDDSFRYLVHVQEADNCVFALFQDGDVGLQDKDDVAEGPFVEGEVVEQHLG